MKLPLKQLANKLMFNCKKYSPEICVGVGIVAGVGAVIMAIKETPKAEEILATHHETVEAIADATERGFVTTSEGQVSYTEEDKKQDMFNIYKITIVGLVKTYAPVVGLMGLSITSTLYSYGILKKRNVAITAAYNALDNAFKKYRANVVEAYGEEVDKNLKLGRYTKQIETTEVDEKGKEKKVKKEVTMFRDPSKYSEFSRFFDEASCYYKRNAEFNKSFLLGQQAAANNILHSRGYIFMNEVYDMLGFDRCTEGQYVGWIDDGTGDGFVDFGIFDGFSEEARDFVNGRESVILLDFNHDGLIVDKVLPLACEEAIRFDYPKKKACGNNNLLG